VRVESHVYTGYRVPPHYDSMIIKIIAHGVDRTEAIRRMRRSLTECVVEGIATTIPFHLQVMDDPVFQRGAVHTGFVAELLARAAAEATVGSAVPEASGSGPITPEEPPVADEPEAAESAASGTKAIGETVSGPGSGPGMGTPSIDPTDNRNQLT
jgi:acetyl/propionyl-CoA carboxylase alpha subunit